MKYLKPLLLLSALGLTPAVNAATIDFEGVTQGSYSTLTIGDVTFTADDNLFEITSASPGSPISGNTIFNYDTGYMIATFAGGGATDFSIGVGDFNSDVDNSYLEAYDVFNNLLDSDYYQNPSSKNGGDFLSVAATSPISYVKFYDEAPFAGAVYWDNATYNLVSAVPEPSTYALMIGGIGMIGFMAARRKKHH